MLEASCPYATPHLPHCLISEGITVLASLANHVAVLENWFSRARACVCVKVSTPGRDQEGIRRCGCGYRLSPLCHDHLRFWSHCGHSHVRVGARGQEGGTFSALRRVMDRVGFEGRSSPHHGQGLMIACTAVAERVHLDPEISRRQKKLLVIEGGEGVAFV